MSSDPVISAIDSAIADHDELLASMKRNAARFDPFGPAPEWATTRGWVPKVSPATTRYEPADAARFERDWLPSLVAAEHDIGLHRARLEQRCPRCVERFTGPVDADFGPVPRPNPFGGPVPSPPVEGSEPAVQTVVEVSAKPRAPLQIIWEALRTRVRG